jgi:hypothetical protein
MKFDFTKSMKLLPFAYVANRASNNISATNAVTTTVLEFIKSKVLDVKS